MLAAENDRLNGLVRNVSDQLRVVSSKFEYLEERHSQVNFMSFIPDRQ